MMEYMALVGVLVRVWIMGVPVVVVCAGAVLGVCGR